jgi:hypothetical protein
MTSSCFLNDIQINIEQSFQFVPPERVWPQVRDPYDVRDHYDVTDH